jgi:hypothetical protein
MKPPRGHQVRTCNYCGGPLKVWNSNASQGAGKYCSTRCADMGRSWQPAIMELLPCTADVIQDVMGTSRIYASHALRRLCDKGIVHIVGMAPNPKAHEYGAESMVLTFAAGPQPDEKVPANFRSALSYFYDKAILAAMPGTQSQIAERTGIPRTTITKRLAVLRKEVNEKGWQQKCFIRSYKRTLGGSPGPFIAVWERGPGRDAPCKIKPRTQREKYERWRDKNERTGRKAEIAAKLAERAKQRKLMQQGDPLISALFGAPAQRKQRAVQPQGARDE